MEVHYHFIREKVLCGDIEMKHVNTGEHIADIFTKGLSRTKFEEFWKQLGITARATVRENGRAITSSKIITSSEENTKVCEFSSHQRYWNGAKEDEKK